MEPNDRVIRIRPVETDADYEAWRQVRLAVLPDERAPSIAELRKAETPQRLFLVAELDGEIAAHGTSDRSNEADRASVIAHEGFQRRR